MYGDSDIANYNSTGDLLLQELLVLIQNKGWTEAEYLRRAGVSRSYLNEWKKGKLLSPTYLTLGKLAAPFNLTANGLLNRAVGKVDPKLIGIIDTAINLALSQHVQVSSKRLAQAAAHTYAEICSGKSSLSPKEHILLELVKIIDEP